MYKIFTSERITIRGISLKIEHTNNGHWLAEGKIHGYLCRTELHTTREAAIKDFMDGINKMQSDDEYLNNCY